jgi:hypothetical protein
MQRRNFLKGLLALPALPAVLKGMEFPAEAAVEEQLEQNIVEEFIAVVPPGTILSYVGMDAPEGWLPCDGRRISAHEYPKLYEVIGQNVPNMSAWSKPYSVVGHSHSINTTPNYSSHNHSITEHYEPFRYVIKV